jgi:uncharacterized protein YkwD
VWLFPEDQQSSSDGGPSAAATTPASIATASSSSAITATAATSHATETAQTSSFQEPDIPSLQRFMLQLVNEDRRKAGLTEVALDTAATRAGLRHAQNMARYGYLSHWDLDGHGPDYRYSQSGGLDNVRENVYTYQGPAPASLEAWKNLIRQAQQSLMESPGHRDNILAPEHTHVGIGIAYNTTQKRLTIAQEFVNRYLHFQLDPASLNRRIGDEIVVSGQVLPGATSPLLNMAYEPHPTAMSVAELNETSTYTSPAETYEPFNLAVDEAGRFSQSVTLNKDGLAGLYHIRIWVETPKFGRVMASDVVIEVY